MPKTSNPDLRSARSRADLIPASPPTVAPSVTAPDWSSSLLRRMFEEMRQREGGDESVMTRPELIRRLAEANPTMRRHDIAVAVEICFREIAAGLARGDRVKLRGLGTFTPKQRKARIGRSPLTGDAIKIAERSVPIFRVDGRLRARLNPAPD